MRRTRVEMNRKKVFKVTWCGTVQWRPFRFSQQLSIEFTLRGILINRIEMIGYPPSDRDCTKYIPPWVIGHISLTKCQCKKSFILIEINRISLYLLLFLQKNKFFQLVLCGKDQISLIQRILSRKNDARKRVSLYSRFLSRVTKILCDYSIHI